MAVGEAEPWGEPRVHDSGEFIDGPQQSRNGAEGDGAVVPVDGDAKRRQEGDVVWWVVRVGGLTDQLAPSSLETLVAEVADAMFPTGGAWATQEEQGRRRGREEAHVPPPPGLVAGHDESLEPEGPAVVDETELEDRVTWAEVELEEVEHKEQWRKAPVYHGVYEWPWPGHAVLVEALVDGEGGFEHLGGGKGHGNDEHEQTQLGAVVGLEGADASRQKEGLD